jgi:hypothetical protein
MDLDACLAASQATPEFVAAVRAFLSHAESPRITTARFLPRVKILRVLTQLLHAEPALAVDAIRIDAASGCSDCRGTVTAATASGPRRFDFVWDCRWRAEQEGWRDRSGYPDQVRAAREFDWRCFMTWTPLVDPVSAPVH